MKNLPVVFTATEYKGQKGICNSEALMGNDGYFHVVVLTEGEIIQTHIYNLKPLLEKEG